MSRITTETSTIEHWFPQSLSARGPVPAGCGPLDYTNLLAVCPGNGNENENENGKGKAKSKVLHCDKKKENNLLSFNPATYDVDVILKYDSDGTISSTDGKFNDELNCVLNLNCSFLKKNRKKALKGFTDGFKNKAFKNKTALCGYLEKFLKNWNGDISPGDLKPFCQMIVNKINEKLKKLRTAP